MWLTTANMRAVVYSRVLSKRVWSVPVRRMIYYRQAQDMDISYSEQSYVWIECIRSVNHHIVSHLVVRLPERALQVRVRRATGAAFPRKSPTDHPTALVLRCARLSGR
jgi:hypothetical protein